MFIEMAAGDAPLCPNAINLPANRDHQLQNLTVNALHEALLKDAGGELTPDSAATYTAATAPFADRMQLHLESVTAAHRGRSFHVETWYFRCSTCGMILPASATPQDR